MSPKTPASLGRMIEQLSNLGDVAKTIAPAVAVALVKDITRQIARSEAPDGSKWKLTKEGSRPLVHAAKALTSSVVGSVAIIKLTGVEARHHYGIVKGGIKRQILPDYKVSTAAERAIQDVLDIEMNKRLAK